MAPIVTAKTVAQGSEAFQTFLRALKVTGGRSKNLNMPFQVLNRKTGAVTGTGKYQIAQSNSQEWIRFTKEVNTNSGKTIQGDFVYNTRTGELNRGFGGVKTERGTIRGCHSSGYSNCGGMAYNTELKISPKGGFDISQYSKDGAPLISLDPLNGTVLQNKDFSTLLSYIQNGKNAEEAQNILKLIG